MPEAVDVGSVLGGRYEVVAHVLASADKDLVLDGVDQVLNRPVSILVASAQNASRVAASARDLATGDRNGNIQVLDLGITESTTYLVTSRAPAADMLDLIVRQDAPYIEPFFTDTLGSEIFGGPRSTEPEASDDEDRYGEYDDEQSPSRTSILSGLTRRFRRRGDEAGPEYDDASDLPPAAVEPASERRPVTHLVPPPPSRRPSGPSVAPSAARYDQNDDQNDDQSGDAGRRRTTAGAVGVGAAGAAIAAQQPGRAASRFPLSNSRDESTEGLDGFDSDADEREGYEPDEYDNDDGGTRKFTRVLVGIVLSLVLVVAVVLAATQIGSVFRGTTVAGDEPGEGTDQTSSAPAVTEEPTIVPTTPPAEAPPEPVTPVIAGITRVVPTNPGLDGGNDVNLPLIVDDNPATFWGNQVYASEAFGGLATNLALVVELEEESAISQVSITQLNGSGGSFSVLVNDQPTLDGAEQIAQGSFTAPTVTLPIPEGADGPLTAPFVIINFTQLPRLSNIQAQYPFGLRIAEIDIT